MIGLDNNNIKAPNGQGFELKSVAFLKNKENIYTPKETMAITMINPEETISCNFKDSHCWRKLKSLIFCAVSWHGVNTSQSYLIKVGSFDFLENNNIISEIEKDYELIRQTIINKGFNSLTGKMGKWIQPRTKGAGYGSQTRAFYARKDLVKYIFANFN